jgi:hypothetical protein
VYGPQSCPQAQFEALPLWLYWGICDQKSFSVFHVKALRIVSPSSLVAHNHQNQWCVQALGSCIGYHYNEVLELHLVLQLSSVARVCRNAGPPTY